MSNERKKKSPEQVAFNQTREVIIDYKNFLVSAESELKRLQERQKERKRKFEESNKENSLPLSASSAKLPKLSSESA